MPKTPNFYLWINGEAREGKDSTEITNPYDGSSVATVSVAGRKQITEAIRGCGKAFLTLKHMSRFERASILEHMVDGLQDATAEMVDALIMEGGKPKMFAEQEFERTLAVFSWAAGESRRFCGECVPMDGMQRGIGYEGYTRREPIGPVLGICPFNFPLNLVSHKVAPALAVGNPILIKPATNTPISALILARIASEAGAPPGSLNVLPVRHADLTLLLSSDEIKMVTFTGSPAVGWALKKKMEKQQVVLELGGNSGTIVDASADLAWAARRCALGGFAQAGQSCIAVQRIYAQTSIFDAFLDSLITETGSLKVGDPRKTDVVVGPVIHSRAADRIMVWIEEAVSSGATIAYGGKRRRMGCGNIIEPTIVTHVKEDMGICCKEIFGPVVTVTPYEELETAIQWCNQSNFGLQAAIFSNDLHHVHQAIDGLHTGGVVVNDFPTYRVDHMPYGGVKDSGLGREGIRSAMLEMTHEKMVVIRKG